MKNRIIGLDILRIFSMCGIIGLHIINQGGLIANANIYSINYYVILFLLIICYTSVDIFGILSGFLNIDKEYNKNKRIIELIVILIFYGIVVPVIFYGFNIQNVRNYGMKELIFNIFPILIGRYWYITCYIFLFFMIPYINKFCKLVDRQLLKKLLLIIFILLTVIPNIFGMIDFFKVLNGYSPFWLLYCYMIGAYIKIYNVDISTNRIIKYLCLLFFAQFLINCTIRNVGFIYFNKIVKEDWFINYISPFTLITSILLVMLFLKINIKNSKISKVFIYFSTMAFSVYIIHCHKLIFDYIFKDLFIFLLKYNFVIIFLSIVCAIIIIYIACCLIDEIRKFIFKIFCINKIIDFIGNKMDKIIN